MKTKSAVRPSNIQSMLRNLGRPVLGVNSVKDAISLLKDRRDDWHEVCSECKKPSAMSALKAIKSATAHGEFAIRRFGFAAQPRTKAVSGREISPGATGNPSTALAMKIWRTGWF
jgi:hypothetical protein